MYCKYMHGITCSKGKAGGSPIPKKKNNNNNNNNNNGNKIFNFLTKYLISWYTISYYYQNL